MVQFVLEHEGAVRLTFFFGILAAMIVYEIAAPKRALSLPRARRWTGN